MLSSRSKRALANKSVMGARCSTGPGFNAEFQTMRMLHAAGADVPEVFSQSNGAILMEYFGDEEAAAPMLNRVTLPREHADRSLRQIIDNITLWLANDLVHGDLSPYNLLYWEDRIVAIDFPQAVDSRINPKARSVARPRSGKRLRIFCEIRNSCGRDADRECAMGELPGRARCERAVSHSHRADD